MIHRIADESKNKKKYQYLLAIILPFDHIVFLLSLFWFYLFLFFFPIINYIAHFFNDEIFPMGDYKISKIYT